MKRRDNGDGTYTEVRPGLWQARLRLGTRPDGRPRRISLYAPTKAEAQRKLKEARRRHETGMRPDVGRLSVAEYLQTWLAAKTGPGTHLRPSTAQRYREVVTLHLIPMLGRHRLLALAPSDVERALADALARGTSLPMVGHAKTVLGTALADAIRDDLVARNAAQAARAPRYQRPEVKPLTREQAQTLVEAVAGHALEPLIVAALATGARQGELLGLHWSDVDLDKGTITIRQALQAGQIVATKTEKSRRTLHVPSHLLTLLRDHRQAQREWRIFMGTSWRGSDNPGEGHVFTNSVGRHLDASAVTRQFQGLLHAAGLPRIRFHDLRHTYATLALAAGVPLHTVSRLLGHSQIAITADTYGHLAPNAAGEVATLMGSLLSRTG